MKKILIFSLILISILAISWTAKNRTKNYSLVLDGKQNPVSYTKFGFTNNDTLVTSDTLTYIFFIEHIYEVNPYIQLTWDKIGANKLKGTVQFFQSFDGSNYVTIKKGLAYSAYSYTLPSVGSDSTWYYNFKKDTAYFEGRFLKLVITSSSLTGVSGVMGGNIKINNK